MTASERPTYQAGDEISIADGVTVILCSRKGRNGIRWSWVIPSTDEGGEGYQATPEEAITNAIKTMNNPECRHGERGWCPTCHDRSDS